MNKTRHSPKLRINTLRGNSIRAVAIGAAATVAVLMGSPASHAAPTLTLSESSGVSAGQTVTITLTGLPPNLPTVAVGQCKPQITLPTDCNLSGSRMGKADEQGVWQPTDGNSALTLAASIGGVDCATTPGACTIAVTSLTNPSNVLASVPLTFGAKEAPKPTAVEANSTESDDGDNTAMMIGIGAAAVLALAAVALLVWRGRRAK